MSTIATLMNTLKDVEKTDAGQSMDLFSTSRETAIQDFLGSMLKQGVPVPEIIFDDKFIAKVREGTGRSNIQALYDSDTKRIILDETSTLSDEKFKRSVSHELLHYIDDLSTPDVEGQTYMTDRPSDQINPENRMDIFRYGLGKKTDGAMYSTPAWAYDFSRIISDPQEHLTYYTQENLGIMPEMVAEDAALRSLDEWQPLVENEPILSRGKWPWSEPEVTRHWTGGIEPQYNILDISAYTQDRGAILDIFDELAGEYLSEKGKSEFYQK